MWLILGRANLVLIIVWRILIVVYRRHAVTVDLGRAIAILLPLRKGFSLE
jgi:hypothetical protein